MPNLITKFPVPLIFKKIHKDTLSGKLTVKDGIFTKILYVSEGQIKQAESDDIQHRLGEFLLGSGRISQEELIMLMRMKDETDEKFGKLLVKHDFMEQRELYKVLVEHKKEIAISMFPMLNGEWTFREGTPEIPDCQTFNINIPEVIIEGCNRITEFKYYQKRFKYRAPVTLPISEDLGQTLQETVIRMYINLNRCKSLSSDQIQKTLNIPEDTFWSQITLLYLLGIVDFTEFRIDAELQQQIEILSDLHDKLKTETIDHYQLLDLKDTASVNEVRDKYFSFSKKHDPDTLNTPSDSQVRLQADFVMEKAAEAYDVLSNQEKKVAYDTGQFKKVTPPPTVTSQKEKRRKAGNLYIKAHGLYEEKRYYEAYRLMEKALKLDKNRASFYMLIGLSQSHIPHLRPEAEKNLLQASKMEPWNADPIFYLGQLYMAEGLVKKAQKKFRQALAINMEHTLAAEMVDRMEQHAKKRSGFSLFGKKE
jgi:tetratricopeptide (TPR) repeat protein